MYVLIIVLTWFNGSVAVDHIDGFSTMQRCEKVASRIETGSVGVNAPAVKARCIEVE